jgi:hypothetical protein
MTPEAKLKAIRHATGASVETFAGLLGFVSANAADNYRQLERGLRPISGTVQEMMKSLALGVCIETLESRLMALAPDYVRMSPLVDSADSTKGAWSGIMRMRYPRFYAVYTAHLPESMKKEVEDSELPRVDAPADSGLGWLIAISQDPYDGNLVPFLEEAAALELGE